MKKLDLTYKKNPQQERQKVEAAFSLARGCVEKLVRVVRGRSVDTERLWAPRESRSPKSLAGPAARSRAMGELVPMYLPGIYQHRRRNVLVNLT
jgi:hypothetical protein